MPHVGCDAAEIGRSLAAVNNELGYVRGTLTQASAQLRSPRTTPAQRNVLLPRVEALAAQYQGLQAQQRSLMMALANCKPLNLPILPARLGATFPLEAYDGALRHLQQQLVRLGFLGAATGKWDWATYQAAAYATQYLGAPYTQHVHASTNTVDINDDWIAALERAAPAPAGTIGLWSSIPHISPWPKRVAVAAGVGALAYGAWRFWKRCRK